MRKKDVPCAGGCGEFVWRGKGCLPPGEATCQRCRRSRRVATCVICGNEFPGTSAKTCSKACLSARMREVSALGAATRPPARTWHCEICGAEYKRTYADQRTCGRRCGAILQRQNRRPAVRLIPQASVAVVRVADCSVCGTQFVTPKRGQTTCSSICDKKAYDREYNRTRPRSDWDRSPRRCPACIDDFEPQYVRQEYCSGPCMKRAKNRRERLAGTRDSGKNHRARARKYGRKYEPIKPKTVFDRDGWICQLCHKPVPKDKKAPHPLSPSLDHIIPMSVPGGDHVYENVQLAHFRCNSLRGAGGVVQLLLIG